MCRIKACSRQIIPISTVAFTLLILLLARPFTVALAQASEPGNEALSNEQIEQLVAPVALHPDSLLSQILMASTYPLEVVQAARWAKDNPDVKGESLEDAMEKQPWDPSVKSLTAFPQVLDMMNADIGWTQKLGDAFLGQQDDVLDAVQRLRAMADKAGNLKTTKEQKVEKQTVTTQSGAKETVIVVEQADPKVIYVPAYNPTVVYGTWPYPTYPPHYWYPPGYVASRLFWFATGVAVGRALWGRCDWGRRTVNINVNTYNSFNRTRITNPGWNHNPRHRHAVPYRNDIANRYRPRTRDVSARENFRGRAEAARRDLPRPGTGQLPGAGQRPNIGTRPTPGRPPAAGQRPTVPQRPTQGARPSLPKPAARPARPTTRPAARPATRPAARPTPSQLPSAFRGVGNGKQVRKQSARGGASRAAPPSRRPPSVGSRPGGGRGGGRIGGRR